MATIKSYSDLNQSRKLAEILPLSSADMYYSLEFVNSAGDYHKLNVPLNEYFEDGEDPGSDIPCWSLASLFNVLPHIQEFYPTLEKINDKYVCRYKGSGIWTNGDNPIDACVAMIELLHEQKLL